MNAVEIEQALSELAEQKFDPAEFPFQFLAAFGEVLPGGVGSGLYGMIIFAILSVFVAGLMVGRTPEFLGKKIEGREMKFAMLAVLILPLIHQRR